MGKALLSIKKKNVIKKTFTDIKLAEANSIGYSNGSGTLTWTADEDCTIILTTARDNSTDGVLKASYSISGGTYEVLYDSTTSSNTTEARHRCTIIEVEQGCVITFTTSSSNGRSIIKIPLTKLEFNLLNFANNIATSGGQVISTNSGTSAGITYEKDHAYLCVGEMGYHDLGSPSARGITISQTSCTYSYITRGPGSGSASYNATLASSPTGTAWGWSATGCAIFIPTAASGSTFNLNPYMNTSYQSGAWATTWTFEIWQH